MTAISRPWRRISASGLFDRCRCIGGSEWRGRQSALYALDPSATQSQQSRLKGGVVAERQQSLAKPEQQGFPGNRVDVVRPFLCGIEPVGDKENWCVITPPARVDTTKSRVA